MADWNNPVYIAWNSAACTLTLTAVILVVVAPTPRFRRGWTSKIGWVAVAVIPTAAVGGYWIPVGAALVMAIWPWRRRPTQIYDGDPLRERTDILPRRYLDGPSET